jgi:hypothetical protein
VRSELQQVPPLFARPLKAPIHRLLVAYPHQCLNVLAGLCAVFNAVPEGATGLKEQNCKIGGWDLDVTSSQQAGSALELC